MQRPVLGAHTQRANRQALSQALTYGSPPHMAAGTLGFSGHREPHRADNPSLAPPYPIPPAMPSPFPDQYTGVKTLKFLKMIFHSSNNTDLKSKENSDFTVQIDKEVLNSINVGMISLSDIVFPAGQYLIEDEWSRIDYSEGILISSFFRDAKVIYPDEDRDNYILEQNGQLPIKNNTIEQIIVENDAENVYRFRTSEPFGTSIEAIQAVFNESLAVNANRFRDTGVQPMSQTVDPLTTVQVQGVTSAHHTQRHLGRSTENIMTHEFRAKLNTNITGNLAKLNPISGDFQSIIDQTGGFGYLGVANLASPLHLASAVSMLLQNAPVFRKHRRDATDAELVAGYPRLSFNIHWEAASDRFYLTYSSPSRVLPVDMPTLDGAIFEYMGFPVPFKLPSFGTGSFNKTIAAPGNRQTNILSGTRVRPGHYYTGEELAFAMEDAFNGTWFGAFNESSNKQNPSPFSIAVKDSGGRLWTPLLCAGRYTPYELAAAFNNYMSTNGAPPIRMEPLFRDSIVYVGMRFFYDVAEAVRLDPKNDRALPFSLLFKSADNTLNPLRIGYHDENYEGASTYYPVAAATRYPTILQGSVPILTPSTQHYRVSFNKELRRLSVKAEPFAPILGCVTSVDTKAQTMVINMPIAHGAAAGEHLFITKILVTKDPALEAQAKIYCDLLEALECGADAPAIAEPLYEDVANGKGDGSETLSCVVLPTESIDDSDWIHGGFNDNIVPRDSTGRRGALVPTQLKLSYGGNFEQIDFAKGDLIYVTFEAAKSWSWDCSWNVSECINRQAIGINPAFYSFNTSYPITTPMRTTSKFTTYVLGTDALVNKSAPKDAIILQSATMSFPQVTLGIVVSDVSVFNLPSSVNLHPFKDVYLVVTINRKDGDGMVIGIESKKQIVDSEPEPHRLREPVREDVSSRGVPLINGAQINALAHILIGPKHPNGIVDLNDRLFEIQYVGVQKIDSFRFQFLNPDGSYYKFHGREVSVGLLLSTVGEQVVTTQ